MFNPSPTSVFSMDSLISASNMFATSIATATTKSNFTNYNMQEMDGNQLLLFLFILLILIYLTMFLGGMIFNLSIVKVFPSVKRVSTLDFFGLYVVLHILFC